MEFNLFKNFHEKYNVLSYHDKNSSYYEKKSRYNKILPEKIKHNIWQKIETDF